VTVKKVVDSHAIIGFLEGESFAGKVEDALKAARLGAIKLFMCEVNWGEVIYIFQRAGGNEAAREALKALDTLPLQIISTDRNLVLKAAEYKATRKMSYADCFAAALAFREKAEIMTGDKEFREVEDEVKVAWL
jgi:predicted nucleic acid-binding protein